MIADAAHHESDATLVRPLGAMERVFYRLGDRHPDHFVLIAEFDEVLTADRLAPALAPVQRRHPLLSVHIEDRPGTRLGFYRAKTVGPIPLSTYAGYSWEAIAGEELSRPFDRSLAPLLRVSLVQSPTRSALLLVFEYSIADGISSLVVLGDLVAALNGEDLTPLPTPQSQEHWVARTLGNVEPLDPSELTDHPRMRTASRFRPFYGAPLEVCSLAMAAADTTRLVEQCRAERTTVQSALLVATTRARAAETGESFVRTLSPINFRSLIGAEQDCAPYLQCTRTGLAPDDRAPFWEQARSMTARLTASRSPRGILTSSNAIRRFMTAEAAAQHAEELLGRILPWDMVLSNLGVQNLDGVGPLRPTAVWGPLSQSQTDNEYFTGVTTYEGRMWIATAGYNVPTTFLKNVEALLMAAVEQG